MKFHFNWQLNFSKYKCAEARGTHGMRHHCVLGQASFYHLCRQWQIAWHLLWFLWSKQDSTLVDVKFMVFQKTDNKNFIFAQKFNMRIAHTNQSKGIWRQLVVEGQKLRTSQNIAPVLRNRQSKDKEEWLKLADKMGTVSEYRKNRNTLVILLRCKKKIDLMLNFDDLLKRKQKKSFCKKSGWKINLIKLKI